MLELQNTLDDLTHRVDKVKIYPLFAMSTLQFLLEHHFNPHHQVKEENLKLKSENGVLGQYIENLMQVQGRKV